MYRDRREYARAYYADHKETPQQYRDKQKPRIERLRRKINRYKERKGCNVCGENDHRCLDFHHIDSDLKENQIASAIKALWSIERIIAEIKKCQILCSNCHRKLHHGPKLI